MEGYSRRKVVAIATVAVLILWVLWIYFSLSGKPRVSLPVKANQLIQSPNTHYSKLGLTYDRIVLPESNCSDVFISVRTTAQFHRSRLLLLLYTWLQTIDPKQVQIVTDSSNDTWINAAKRAGFRIVIPPDCETGHTRTPLCCKTGYEFEQYYKATEAGKRYRWYCHFDDDEYVNIPVLMRTLHVHEDKLYLGYWPSNSRWWRGRKVEWRSKEFPDRKRSSFRYATGAAFCISSTLMPQMERYIRGSTLFASTCGKLHFPEDLAIGAIIGKCHVPFTTAGSELPAENVIKAILGYNLTEVPQVLNQNTVGIIRHNEIKNQVTISYKGRNRVTIPGAAFTKEQDPTSFLSYHCLLYPSTSWCKQRPKKRLT